jgi:N utilization substance protein B
MKRSVAREIAVRLCFCISENPSDPKELLASVFEDGYYSTLKSEDALFEGHPGGKQLEYISRLVEGVHGHAVELDGYIDKYAVGWRFGRISRTALAVMKVAMYEVLYMPDVPPRAAINEAMEIAKHYETPETLPFINGVLGSFARSESVDKLENRN